MPCKHPALALQILLCISAMTAEELFLVALAFVVTLKRNGLLASSLFFLFAITFFFCSSYRVQVWSPTGWWQQVNYQCKRALYPMSLSRMQLSVWLGSGYWGHCAAGLREGGPKPAAGTPSSVHPGKGRVLCFPEEDSGPSSASQLPQPHIWGPGPLSPCPNPATRAPSASLPRAGRRYQLCDTFLPKDKRQKPHKPGRTAAEEMPRGQRGLVPVPVLPRSGAAASRRKPSAQLLRS